MPIKYKNPPVIEVVCEFRFTSETEWDSTVPGLLYEKLQGVFPTKQDREVRGIRIGVDPEHMQLREKVFKRSVFLTQDKTKLVQVGDRLLAVNCLRPYPSWEKFIPTVREVFSYLCKVVDIKGISRLALLYVNKVDIPEKEIQLKDYFQYYPLLPRGEDIPKQLASFFVGTMLRYGPDSDSDTCRVELTLGSADEENEASFLLRLEYNTNKPGIVSPQDSLQWIDNAHSRIEDVFEGCITDKLRDLFERIDS